MKNPKKSILTLLTLTLFIWLSACSNHGAPDSYNYSPSMAKEAVEQEVDYYGDEAVDRQEMKVKTVANQDGGRITEQTKVQPKIIKNASVRYQVENAKEARSKMNALVESSKAYITSEDESKSGYSLENNMVIRVPSENFDDLLVNLVEVAIYIDHKRINAKDVTAEYIDIESRLENRKKVEKHFHEILQKAKTVKEILEVENEIRKIREEIDAAEGRLKYLRDQVSFSTINLSYYEKLDYEAAPERSYFTKIGKAFSEGWKGFLEFTIALMYAWPFWIVFGVLAWLIRRWWRRRILRQRKQEKGLDG